MCSPSLQCPSQSHSPFCSCTVLSQSFGSLFRCKRCRWVFQVELLAACVHDKPPVNHVDTVFKELFTFLGPRRAAAIAGIAVATCRWAKGCADFLSVASCAFHRRRLQHKLQGAMLKRSLYCVSAWVAPPRLDSCFSLLFFLLLFSVETAAGKYRLLVSARVQIYSVFAEPYEREPHLPQQILLSEIKIVSACIYTSDLRMQWLSMFG